MPPEAKIWNAECPSCGRVQVKQKTKPTSCKEVHQFGPRSFRECRGRLVNQHDVTGHVVASGAGHAVENAVYE